MRTLGRKAASQGPPGRGDAAGSGIGKLLNPHRKREAVDVLRDRYGASERRACRVLCQPRATQRYLPMVCDDELPLTRRIIELRCLHGLYGYFLVATRIPIKRQHSCVVRPDSMPVSTKLFAILIPKNTDLCIGG